MGNAFGVVLSCAFRMWVDAELGQLSGFGIVFSCPFKSEKGKIDFESDVSKWNYSCPTGSQTNTEPFLRAGSGPLKSQLYELPVVALLPIYR